MNILVLGGTRFLGIHLVNQLLENNHSVTIATRGQAASPFGNRVKYLRVDRTDERSVKDCFKGEYFELIYDNIAFTSKDVKFLLDILQPKHYILTSTMSVYKTLHTDVSEFEFNPLSYPLIWCIRQDYPYAETKRQAECALFQEYSHISSSAVRLPFVIGKDDYTRRLYFYVEHIIKSQPMNIDNLNEKLGFIRSDEAGAFLAWLATQNHTGCINASSRGSLSISEVIRYIEQKTGKKALVEQDSESAPYNNTPSYNLNLSYAESLGYKFTDINDWIYELLDYYILQVSNL